jgi:hypothetical protein
MAFSGCVQSLDNYSYKLLVSNGVGQGGILNPALFHVYFNGFLNKLAEIKIGGNFLGCLAYADDVILLGSTTHAMRKILCTYEELARLFHV